MKQVPKHMKPPRKGKRKLSWTRKMRLIELANQGYDITPFK